MITRKRLIRVIAEEYCKFDHGLFRFDELTTDAKIAYLGEADKIITVIQNTKRRLKDENKEDLSGL